MYATEKYVEHKIQTLQEIKSFLLDVKNWNQNITKEYIVDHILEIMEKNK